MARTVKVDYVIAIEPETNIPFEGNCSAIDPETDRKQEEWIRSELAAGNDYAWCMVLVKAYTDNPADPASPFEGFASCGGCSYRNRAELERDMIPDLKLEALSNLRAELVRAVETEKAQHLTIIRRASAARRTLARLPKRVRG